MKENYWARAKDNKEKAREQMHFMEKNYFDCIKDSVNRTKTYAENWACLDWTRHNPSFQIPKYFLLDMDTIQVLFFIKKNLPDWDSSEVTILNFASFTSPGGKFIEGSNAQEECLCHASNLYNILKNFENEYYKDNRNAIAINRQLYVDRALYTPDVLFHDIDRKIFTTANVITCAAPFWEKAKEQGVTKIENDLVLSQRMNFIKEIAESNNTDILILGAWGCGVFGQNPKTVASFFNFIFSRPSSIRTVVFAVPSFLNPDNYKAFDECIKNREI